MRLALEPPIIEQVGTSGSLDWIAIIAAVPVEVDAAGGEADVQHGGECAEGHLAGAIGVDAKEGRAA